MTDALAQLARRVGIAASYTDQTGRVHHTTRATTRALLGAMGLPTKTIADAAEHLARIAADCSHDLPDWHVSEPEARPALALPDGAAWQLRLEDGETVEGRGAGSLPVLPLGLHRLRVGPQAVTLICAPRRLPLPARAWGVGLPLYALSRDGQSGLGDYDDLARTGEGLARHGPQFLGLNPVHAGFPEDPENFSPYTPSHRRRLNVLHVPTDVRAGAPGPLIDYSAETPAILRALRKAHSAAPADPDFDAFRHAEGAALERFALHQALSETLGPYWNHWPAGYQQPGSEEVARARAELAEQIGFHAWLQWRAERALGAANRRVKAAGMAHGLYLDLAVGTHPFGAETWEDRESFARGVSLGAPPDAFSADGQSWGLAPFNPLALVAKGFAPLAETLRRQLSFAGLIRIDHILGFDRAFWVPDDPGLAGCYVRMPLEAMLAITRLEAARVGAVVVGEDLGNVPRGLRPRLRASGILGCRVQIFEKSSDDPPAFRSPLRQEPATLVSFSTHDLPTWLGWRDGRDIAARHRLGGIDDATAAGARDHRAAEVDAFDRMTAEWRPSATPAEAPSAMHSALAASRARLAMVQVETLLEMADQPNLPGTVDSYPNWRQRLPVGTDSLHELPALAETATTMTSARR